MFNFISELENENLVALCITIYMDLFFHFKSYIQIIFNKIRNIKNLVGSY